MLNEAALNQHLARVLSASGTANDLLQLCEELFGRAVILRKQPAVCVQYADDGQIRPVVAFGQNLRANHDVHFTGGDLLQLPLQCAFETG